MAHTFIKSVGSATEGHQGRAVARGGEADEVHCFPKWLISTNEGNAMDLFYEGLPRGSSTAWGDGSFPLLRWRHEGEA